MPKKVANEKARKKAARLKEIEQKFKKRKAAEKRKAAKRKLKRYQEKLAYIREFENLPVSKNLTGPQKTKITKRYHALAQYRNTRTVEVTKTPRPKKPKINEKKPTAKQKREMAAYKKQRAKYDAERKKLKILTDAGFVTDKKGLRLPGLKELGKNGRYIKMRGVNVNVLDDGVIHESVTRQKDRKKVRRSDYILPLTDDEKIHFLNDPPNTTRALLKKYNKHFSKFPAYQLEIAMQFKNGHASTSYEFDALDVMQSELNKYGDKKAEGIHENLTGIRVTVFDTISHK